MEKTVEMSNPSLWSILFLQHRIRMLEQISSAVSGGFLQQKVIAKQFSSFESTYFSSIDACNGLLFSHGWNKRFKGMKQVEYVHVKKFYLCIYFLTFYFAIIIDWHEVAKIVEGGPASDFLPVVTSDLTTVQ